MTFIHGALQNKKVTNVSSLVFSNNYKNGAIGVLAVEVLFLMSTIMFILRLHIQLLGYWNIIILIN